MIQRELIEGGSSALHCQSYEWHEQAPGEYLAVSFFLFVFLPEMRLCNENMYLDTTVGNKPSFKLQSWGSFQTISCLTDSNHTYLCVEYRLHAGNVLHGQSNRLRYRVQIC